MGGNFEFQVQDSFLEYVFEIGRFEKRIALSEKKPPLQNSKIYAWSFCWPKITLNDFKTVMDYSILFWIKSIFLTKQYVLDMDQKAKLYNKGYFWSSPKSFGFLHKFQLQLQKQFDHIAFDFIVQKKLHCLAVDQSMYKKRNMFQQYNDTYFLIRSRKN